MFSSAAVSFIYKPVLLPTLFQNLGEFVQLPQPDSDFVVERLVVNPHLSLGVRQRRLFHRHTRTQSLPTGFTARLAYHICTARVATK